ncbi:MAG: molybdopterin molybdotransferase MoeA [Dehalococcoidia bacterium]|nr:MAG: molybdopterin molybdotransferase MoeA [Dehalococcoidia bacterium]
MISVDRALDQILGCVTVLEAEPAPILETLGQVLAEDIYATFDIPPRDNSAMDGYVVRSADTAGASPQSPRLLRVIDTVMAGSISEHEVVPGTAIRIMTGAPIPRGADAVARFEITDAAQRKDATREIAILAEVKAGEDLRRAGEDITKGAKVLSRRTVIRPAEVGVLASLGRAEVAVIRRPRVAILVTGDELVDINKSLPTGKIYDSNTYSLAALVRRYGGIPQVLGLASDSEDLIRAKLNQNLDADMLITTGGVSMGDFDVVKDVLAKEGKLVFWKVRMRPGRPVTFGRLKGRSKAGVAKEIVHLGLPGNPVSAMVTFEVFARPAMLKMMGRENLAKPTIEAIIEESIDNDGGFRIFARAVVAERNGRYFARLTGPQGAGILTSMSRANGLVVITEDRLRVEKGETVPVVMLDWDEER